MSSVTQIIVESQPVKTVGFWKNGIQPKIRADHLLHHSHSILIIWHHLMDLRMFESGDDNCIFNRSDRLQHPCPRYTISIHASVLVNQN